MSYARAVANQQDWPIKVRESVHKGAGLEIDNDAKEKYATLFTPSSPSSDGKKWSATRASQPFTTTDAVHAFLNESAGVRAAFFKARSVKYVLTDGKKPYWFFSKDKLDEANYDPKRIEVHDLRSKRGDDDGADLFDIPEEKMKLSRIVCLTADAEKAQKEKKITPIGTFRAFPGSRYTQLDIPTSQTQHVKVVMNTDLGDIVQPPLAATRFVSIRFDQNMSFDEIIDRMCGKKGTSTHTAWIIGSTIRYRVSSEVTQEKLTDICEKIKCRQILPDVMTLEGKKFTTQATAAVSSSKCAIALHAITKLPTMEVAAFIEQKLKEEHPLTLVAAFNTYLVFRCKEEKSVDALHGKFCGSGAYRFDRMTEHVD